MITVALMDLLDDKENILKARIYSKVLYSKIDKRGEAGIDLVLLTGVRKR